MSAYEKLQQFMREKRGTFGANILNAGDRVTPAGLPPAKVQAIATPEVGDKISYMSPQFDDDDQHIGWNECHGIVEMVDQNNQMFLIQQDETPLWAWVPERFITN